MKTIRTALAAAVATTALLTVAAPAAHAADSPAAQDIAAWARSGHPDRLMVIRPGSIALVHHGTVVNRLYPAWGAVPFSWLAANAGSQWVGYDSGSRTVRVRAAVLLTPGTTLNVGRGTSTVLLTAGKTAASGTWIRGSRATLDIDGVTLASATPGGTRPAPAGTAGRPYLAMGAGGRMDITDTTVTGFGRPGSAPPLESGVTWGKGSTGSADGSTFQGNRTGLRLAGSHGVTLDKVTVKDSVEDGLVLSGDQDTGVRSLTSEANGRNGVSVGGTDGRILSGVTTREDKGVGIKATAQRGLTLTAPVSHADGGGGIRLVSCAYCTVQAAAVDGAPVGVAVSGAGAQVTVGGPRLSGGAGGAGVSLAADIAAATVTGGTIGGYDQGIAVAGPNATVDGTAITGARTGVAVYGHAAHVALRRVKVTGGRVGVTASGTTSGVTLSGVSISDVSGKGLSSASPGLQVTGGSVSGGTTAVDLGASARLRALTVSGARRGVHLAAGVRATGEGLDVLAERKGIEADARARMSITDSRVRAPVALAGKGSVKRLGHTTISLPPFPWLGFAALVALTLAVVLQSVHQVRHRKTPRPRVAAHVRNIA